MNKNTINQVNLVLVCSLTIVYLAYLNSMKKYRLTGLLVALFVGTYTLTNKYLISMIFSVIVVLSLEAILKKYEAWDVDMNIGTGKTFNLGSDTVENFKGSSKRRKRRKRRKKRKVEHFDDDDVEESYIDLGTSFLEAYKSLTPQQVEKMSNDTRSLMGHQKKLIETLDNLGPVIKGGKKIMEQFKHYFKDEI